MNKKRCLSIIMAVLMALSLLPSLVFAAAAPSGELGGKLKIKGTAAVGCTLSADYKNVTPEGMTDDYVTFQWSKKTGDTVTELGTNKTYTVAEADLGVKITLKVTGKQDSGVTGELTAETTYEIMATEEEALALSDTAQVGADTAEPQETEDIVEDIVQDNVDDQALEAVQLPEEDFYNEVQPEETDTGIPEATDDGTMSEEQDAGYVQEPSEDAADTENPQPDYMAAASVESESGTMDFGTAAVETLSDIEPQYALIKNTGTGDLNFLEIAPEHFMVEDIETTLAPGEEISVWVMPREGLEPGVYDDVITYTAEEGAEAFFEAKIVVEEIQGEPQGEDPDMKPVEEQPEDNGVADEADMLAEIGNSTGDIQNTEIQNPDTQNTEIPNTDNQGTDTQTSDEPNTDNQGTDTQNPDDQNTDTPTPDPDANPTENPTEPEKPEEPSGEQPADPVYPEIQADPTEAVFNSYEEGKVPENPEVQTITLTNLGTESVILNQPAAENFVIGPLSNAEILPGETASFTISPRYDLTEGDYKEDINITMNDPAKDSENDDNLQTTVHTLTVVSAVVSVTKAQPVYKVTVEPEDVVFDSAEEGYEDVFEQTVTIRNEGTAPITFSQPTSDYFEFEDFSDMTVEPGEAAQITVYPLTGLTNGDYLEVVQLPNDQDIQVLVNLHFVVEEAENKLISVGKTADITGLKNGVKKSAESLGLPKKMNLKTTQGKVKADVKWDVKGCEYDPSSTDAQTFAVKGKVVLPDGVTNPDKVSLIVSINVSVNGYTPVVPSPSENTIIGIDPNGDYTTETKITITAVGAGMDNNAPGKGDVRYVPLNWRVLETRSWDSAPYTATFRMGQSGSYTLSVVYNTQKFDGSNWTNTGEQDTRQVSFTVRQAGVTPTITGQNLTPAPNQKNAVKTGDDTNIAPFIIILIIAAACIVGVVVYRRKKK